MRLFQREILSATGSPKMPRRTVPTRTGTVKLSREFSAVTSTEAHESLQPVRVFGCTVGSALHNLHVIRDPEPASLPIHRSSETSGRRGLSCRTEICLANEMA